jgi:hypothetical protein
MANKVEHTSIFESYFKKYCKKFPSLNSELKELEKELLENPELGTDLGNNLYKIRLACKSKNVGKSGGFRIITYLLNETKTGKVINLLIMYDILYKVII